uniref:Uncharacterized protein MANES_18G078900 n=1 Tax=Rhizophora mucronata TaxID=61149 RepID=A0A2P2K8V8_RHIMU
MRRQRALWLRS